MNQERSWRKIAPRPRRRGRTKGKSCSLLALPCHFSFVMSRPMSLLSGQLLASNTSCLFIILYATQYITVDALMFLSTFPIKRAFMGEGVIELYLEQNADES